MNNRFKFIGVLLFLLAAIRTQAQMNIPSVWDSDSSRVRVDSMTRMYIPSKRIMWISNDSLVSNSDLLLLPGTG